MTAGLTEELAHERPVHPGSLTRPGDAIAVRGPRDRRRSDGGTQGR